MNFTSPGLSFKNVIAVTPSDSLVYSPRLQALYIGTAGDLDIVNSQGQSVTYANAEGWFFVEIAKVLASTAATDIVGHY